MTGQEPAARQVWSAGAYARNARFVSELGADLLTLLDSRCGERILDLGCGDGALTERIAATGAAVTGLEADPSMAAAARARGLTVHLADAHDPFPEAGLDAVFSNAVLHWMRDPARVLANVFAALRPGGRLVAEQGGFGNIAAIIIAFDAAREAAGLPPVRVWDYPSPTLQRSRLEGAGFAVEAIALFPRPTPLPTGMAGWLATFAGPVTRDLPEADRAAFLADVERRLWSLNDPAEGWVADYVRLRFVARRPG
jgi:trans-aconitate methyltransferase